jgi:hypothetical protein
MLFRRLWVVVFLLGSCALGQEPRGTILGRVVDSSGAVVPGATVKVTNAATGVSTPLTTNQDGNYLALYLIPGTYRVEAETTGFKRSIREGLELRVNDRIEVNIALEVGNVSEQLTVVAQTPLLETATASMGSVVDSRRVADLPIPHGQFYNLIQLSPGAMFAGNLSQDRQYEVAAPVAFAMNGTRSNRSEISVDGVTMTATNTANQVLASYVPPVDAVAEFKVQTAPFDASVGNTEGGVVNVSLKSGTNALHGTGYYVKMAPSWNANTFFANRAGQPGGDFTYNRWGAVASGPIVVPGLYNGRTRSFFLYAYEGAHDERPRGTTTTVPTAEQREGNFSGLLKLGSQYQIYDPATRRSAAGGRYQSDPLPGNIIPSSRISPVAQNILKYYALPNQPGTADGRNNLVLPNEPESTKYYTHTVRLDHNLSDRHRIFGRTNFMRRNSRYSNWFKNIATGEWFRSLAGNVAFDDVYSFSPTFVMNTRLSYNRWVRTYDASDPAGYGFDLTTLGFPASYNNAIDPVIRRFPYITINGYVSTFNGSLWRPTETKSFAAAFDKVQGTHSLKFGVEFRAYDENQYNHDNVSTGSFSFDTAWTRGPFDNSPAAPIGQGLATMLLGLPTGGSVARRASYAERSTVWSLYLQDDWKLTRKLAVTLGLRYEMEGPLTERFNRSIRGLNYDAVLPIEGQVKANYAKSPTPEVPAERFQVRGGLTFAGIGGLPRTLWERDANNFMPRIGLAYSVTPDTVLRGGYGIFYGTLGSRRGDVNQTGFSQNTNLIPSLDGGLTFVATLANPFPTGIQEPLGAAQGAMTYVGQGISFFNTKPLTAYMQRWQMSIQRALPHRIVLEAGYVGNRGTKIETSRDLNALPVQHLSRTGSRDQPLINYLSANLPNPFYPLLPGTGRAGTVIARDSLLAAYPQFTSLSTTGYQGYSWYHSLQAKADKRFSHGFTVQVGYTWSKYMDASAFMDGGDPMPVEVISDQDFSHRLSLSWIWELPFGRGRRLMSNVSPIASAILSGWQVQGLFSGQSGAPLGFGNSIFYGNLNEIVLPKDKRAPERWFNVDAGFERATARQLSYAARTMSLRFSGIRGDGVNVWDLSAIKDTRIREGMKAQFRAEFLNAFNHVLFSDPNTSVTSTAFGSITSQKGYPRRIQLGVKFVY